LHMAQLMPLPLTVSCFSKIQIGFTFLVPAHTGSPGKRAVKRVCVCECGLVFGFCCALCRCGEGRAAIKGYLLPAAPTAANPLHNVAAGEWDGQTDGHRTVT